LVVIDTQTSAAHEVALDSQALNDWALHYLTAGVMWWSADEDRFFLITANRGGTRYALCSVDVGTGRTREILQETAQFNVRLNPSDYSRPNVFVSSKGDEVVWYSERSGYGHLYLYDGATGELKRQITRASGWCSISCVSMRRGALRISPPDRKTPEKTLTSAIFTASVWMAGNQNS
jgi:hypothetical protein